MRVAAFLTALMLSTVAVGQSSDNASIIVDGQQIKKQASDFVRAITRKTSTDQYAQFSEPLCPQVIGYERMQVETFLSHLQTLAEKSNIPVEESGCKPNVVVVLAPDPDALLQRMKKKGSARFIRMPYSPEEQARQAAMPIRWWHDVTLADASGRRLNASSMALASTGAANEFTTSGSGAGRAERSGAGMVSSSNSLILKSTAATINASFVLVNMNAVKGYPLASVADYAAFVALAQINPKTDFTGMPSILSLFAAAPDSMAEPPRLSEWDFSYIRALTDAPRNGSASRQRSNMALHMQTTLQPADGTAAAPDR